MKQAQVIVEDTELDYIMKSAFPLSGAVQIATATEEAGVNCTIVDCSLDNDEQNRIDYEAQCFFFPTTLLNYKNVTNRVRKIKKHNPNAIIGLGGPHATGGRFLRIMPQLMLESQRSIDFVGSGPGEHIVHDIVTGKEFSEIYNIIWRDKSGNIISNPTKKVELETTPIPNYNLIDDINKYFITWQKKAINPLFKGTLTTSIQYGCDKACTWCAIPDNYFSRKSPARAALEEARIFNEFGPDIRIYESGSNSVYDIAWQMEHQRELRKILGKKKPSWYGFGQLAPLNTELIEVLKGTYDWFGYFIGIESGSDRILKKEKGISRQFVKDKLRMLVEHNVRFNLSFIVGHEGETRKDLEDTIELAEWTVNLAPPNPNGSNLGIFSYRKVPMPGSKDYNKLMKAMQISPTDITDINVTLMLQELYNNRFSGLTTDDIFSGLARLAQFDINSGGYKGFEMANLVPYKFQEQNSVVKVDVKQNSDVKTYMKLINHDFPPAPLETFPGGIDATVDMFYKRGNRVFGYIGDDGYIKGMLAYIFGRPEETVNLQKDLGYIYLMHTSPSVRGTEEEGGPAFYALLKHALAQMRTDGINNIEFRTSVENQKARMIFEKHVGLPVAQEKNTQGFDCVLYRIALDELIKDFT